MSFFKKACTIFLTAAVLFAPLLMATCPCGDPDHPSPYWGSDG